MDGTFADVVESLGYRVSRYNDSFQILLPLWCSVRVGSARGGLTVEPRFGTISRTVATWLTVLVMLGIWLLSLQGTERDLLLYGILLILAVVWDVYRYILTEGAMSVVRHAYLSRERQRA
jgi:hypothetical protein